MTDFRTDKSYAQALDAADPLRGFRDRFHIPHTKDGAESIYLCGNSLGLQPKATKDALLQELQDWQDLGVEGHFHARNPWLPYHEFLTESYARLVGASPLEVVAMNTLSVNLHLMMVSFYRPTTQRYKIIIEAHAFPSDRYAVQSQLLYHGFKPETDMIELKPRD
ncbi:MAG: kynureninase, partial [Alphaproteobacteria bacterium]|nr:kynureninase [Alphaproteobacteria bacterium]